MTSNASAQASDPISGPVEEPLKTRRDVFRNYLRIAPAALAIERSLECEILAQHPFLRPVLDIGCGDGVFAAILCDGRIDTGIDYDPAEIERARVHQAYEELIVCGGDAIPKPDASYQTIFSNSVLEHIPDLIPVLKEAHRLLAPGGRFYVTIPTDRWERSVLPARLFRVLGLEALARRYQVFYNRFWAHHHAYDESRWAELFAEQGFTVVDQRCYVPPNLTTLLDILTPLAGPAMISKKLLGRWIALPWLRALTVPILAPLLQRLVAASRMPATGNLVFFSLTR